MKRNLIELVGVAPVGLAISINGQRYDLIGHEPFTRQSGEEATLMVWQGECATCGAGFISKTTPGRFAETRRCEEHRRPGTPVRKTAP